MIDSELEGHTTKEILKKLFDEDQADRPDDPAFIADIQTNPESAQTFLTNLRKNDALRRQKVIEILTQNPSLDADDFYHIAFIFQHGELLEDYMRAFMYSVKAVEAGCEPYISLVTQSFDRYAITKGSDQRYGTQSGSHPDGTPIEPRFADDLSDDEIMYFMLPRIPTRGTAFTEQECVDGWEKLPHDKRASFLSNVTSRFNAQLQSQK